MPAAIQAGTARPAGCISHRARPDKPGNRPGRCSLDRPATHLRSGGLSTPRSCAKTDRPGAGWTALPVPRRPPRERASAGTTRLPDTPPPAGTGTCVRPVRGRRTGGRRWRPAGRPGGRCPAKIGRSPIGSGAGGDGSSPTGWGSPPWPGRRRRLRKSRWRSSPAPRSAPPGERRPPSASAPPAATRRRGRRRPCAVPVPTRTPRRCSPAASGWARRCGSRPAAVGSSRWDRAGWGVRRSSAAGRPATGRPASGSRRGPTGVLPCPAAAPPRRRWGRRSSGRCLGRRGGRICRGRPPGRWPRSPPTGRPGCGSENPGLSATLGSPRPRRQRPPPAPRSGSASQNGCRSAPAPAGGTGVGEGGKRASWRTPSVTGFRERKFSPILKII